MWYSTVKALGFCLLIFQLQPGCEKKELPAPGKKPKVAQNGDPRLQRVEFRGQAQGTTYQVIYLNKNGKTFQPEVESILEKMDRSLSLYHPASLINRFNEDDRGGVMDLFFKEVVKKAGEISRQSEGAFDITVKPLVDAWGFGVKRHTGVPDSSLVEMLLGHTGYHLLEIKGDSLLKKDPAVQIDANGIAQGYTLDVLAGFLESRNIRNYLIELGGEIRVKGKNEAGRPWRIGIESPPGEDGRTAPLSKIISVSGKGLSTSGNYRRFFESGGKHYAHTIDPRTGYPSQNRLISVTVVARDCITADAWDNALMVWGMEASMKKLRAYEGIEAYFIYTNENGEVRDTCTAGFETYFTEALPYRQ